MKKLFITALGAFAFSLMLSATLQNNNLVENSAFAGSTCCPETSSICVTPTWNIENYYGKPEGGSCNEKPKELTLAP